jgi:hypothetical protein
MATAGAGTVSTPIGRLLVRVARDIGVAFQRGGEAVKGLAGILRSGKLCPSWDPATAAVNS